MHDSPLSRELARCMVQPWGFSNTQFQKSEPYSVHSGDSGKVSEQERNWLDMMLVGELGLKDTLRLAKLVGKGPWRSGEERLQRGDENEKSKWVEITSGPCH